ncbi:MAG: sulfite exporter TauE/SafE family protein [Chloroflexi bacterium]|nr:sulfite exporter TauE/SafE family protein [Chloroflexota bacterium]
MAKRPWFAAIVIGAAAGTLAGLMGVGGGLIMVPLFVGLMGVEQHQAHGTSLAVIPVIAIFGVLPYVVNAYVRWDLALYVAVGSTLGVIVGARLMARLPARLLRRLFGLLVIAVGVRFLISGG